MAGGKFSEALLYGMTIRESANDGSDFTNPAADYRRLFLGEDGVLHLRDSAGTVTTPSAASGAVTGSGLTMATARLLGRTTASTGAIEEITVGSGLSLSAGALTASGGGISSGTSNPGSPTNGDLFYRSDLDLLIRYRSSGTRWVCVCPHVLPIAIQAAVVPMSATGSLYAPLDSLTADIYVERVTGATIIPSGTSNATNYWTISAGAFGSFDTKTDGNASTRHDLTASPGVVVPATAFWFELTVTKTLSPGNIYVFMGLFYRYIAA